jgi:hypothetical protein
MYAPPLRTEPKLTGGKMQVRLLSCGPILELKDMSIPKDGIEKHHN